MNVYFVFPRMRMFRGSISNHHHHDERGRESRRNDTCIRGVGGNRTPAPVMTTAITTPPDTRRNPIRYTVVHKRDTPTTMRCSTTMRPFRRTLTRLVHRGLFSPRTPHPADPYRTKQVRTKHATGLHSHPSDSHLPSFLRLGAVV